MQKEEMTEFNQILNDNLNYYMDNIYKYNEIIYHFSKYVVDNYKEILPFSDLKPTKLSKSIKYSQEFMRTIDKKYSDVLEYGIKNKEFKFYYSDDEDCYCYYDEAMNKWIAEISLNDTINDAYSISHEFIHYIEQQQLENPFEDNFCEIFSLLSELLQEDYFEEHGITRKKKAVRKINYDNLYYNSVICKFDIEIISAYLKHGSVNLKRLYKILLKYNDRQLDFIKEEIDNIMEFGELGYKYGTVHRYVIGQMLSNYIYYDLKENPKMISDYFTVGKNIDKYSETEFFHFLDLEVKEKDSKVGIIDLNDESYDKIFKCYKKELKRL